MNEFFKFRTYVESLESALKLKEKFYSDKPAAAAAADVGNVGIKDAVTM